MQKFLTHMLMYFLYFIWLLCCKLWKSGPESLSWKSGPGLPGLQISWYSSALFYAEICHSYADVFYVFYSFFVMVQSMKIWIREPFLGNLILLSLVCTYLIFSCIILCRYLSFICWCCLQIPEFPPHCVMQKFHLIYRGVLCTLFCLLCCKLWRSGSESLSRNFDSGLHGLHIRDFSVHYFILCRNFPFMCWCIFCTWYVGNTANNEDQDQKAFRGILVLVFLACTYRIFFCMVLCRNFPFICLCSFVFISMSCCENEDQDQKAFRGILILVFLVFTYLFSSCVA